MKKKVSKKVAVKRMVKSMNRRVDKANKEFEAMKPAEKRVAIARDVIAQLDAKRLVPMTGSWLSQTKGNLLDGENVAKNKDTEVCDLFKGMKECTGCALGGLFLSAVEKADKLKVKDLSRYYVDQEYADDITEIEADDAFTYLKKFFTRHQLDLVESAFERGDGAAGTMESYDFAEEVEDDSLRMRLIMENIIANDGSFKPKKKPVIAYVTPGFTG